MNFAVSAMVGSQSRNLASSTTATASPSPTQVGQSEAEAALSLDVVCRPGPRLSVAVAF